MNFVFFYFLFFLFFFTGLFKIARVSLAQWSLLIGVHVGKKDNMNIDVYIVLTYV